MILTVFSFLLVFMVVALTHEFGHFLMAKRAGIRVLEFSMGFGPVLFSRKHDNTIYSLRLIPMAGFVRLAGIEDESEDEKNCPEDEKYYNKPPAAKFKALLAGPLANLVLGFLLFSLLAMTFGTFKEVSREIESIIPGSPAQKAGMQVGDIIERIDGVKIGKMEEAIGKIHQSKDKTLTLEINRSGNTLSLKIPTKYDAKRKMAFLGFQPKVIYEVNNPFVALWLGLQQTVTLVGLLLYFLGQLLIGRVSFGELAGPVGIAQFTGQAAQGGIYPLLGFIAFLSINLGVVNLLPIPALDGGRLVFVLVEWIRKKPVNIELENKIHYYGLIALLGLMALTTINDLRRIFHF